MKRVRKHETFDFLGDLIALDTQCRQLLRQTRQNDAGGLSAQDNDRLLGERLSDLRGRIEVALTA